ncbi:MAG: hypothetical protein C0582_01525 [Alphaproteobacteria bacterium]|nr:MAG: hypothetical protein C0582_01525 [Alphaproteobacteria bacterium]
MFSSFIIGFMAGTWISKNHDFSVFYRHWGAFIGIGGVISIAIYMIFGQPGLPDFPFHALNSPTSEVYFRKVSQQKKIIEALKREPDNVRLWKNLSETYQRINQAKAQSHIDKYIIFLERQLQEASSISKSAHMRHTK